MAIVLGIWLSVVGVFVRRHGCEFVGICTNGVRIRCMEFDLLLPIFVRLCDSDFDLVLSVLRLHGLNLTYFCVTTIWYTMYNVQD